MLKYRAATRERPLAAPPFYAASASSQNRDAAARISLVALRSLCDGIALRQLAGPGR